MAATRRREVAQRRPRRARRGAGRAASAATSTSDEGRALPGLQPRREQPAGGGQRRACAAPPSLAAALVGEQAERHQADGHRREQVAPQVGAGPQLARDEVEVELHRRPPPMPVQPTSAATGEAKKSADHERQRGGRRGAEEAAAQRQRAGEQREHGHRLPDHVGGHHAEPEPVQQAREQHARVHERARPVLEVVEVADRHVLARLAQPGEVLERVRDEEAVAAGHEAALGPDAHEQAGQRREGEREQRDQDSGLEAVEAAGPGRLGTARALGRLRPLGSSSGGAAARCGPRGRTSHVPRGEQLAHHRHEDLAPSGRASPRGRSRRCPSRAAGSRARAPSRAPRRRRSSPRAACASRRPRPPRARQSLKPQKRSVVGSRSSRRQSCWKPRPTMRRRSGWRRPSAAPSASREPTTTSASSISSSICGSEGRQTAQSASQWRRSSPRASSIPRRIEWPLPRLRSLRSRRTRSPSSERLEPLDGAVRARVVDDDHLEVAAALLEPVAQRRDGRGDAASSL